MKHEGKLLCGCIVRFEMKNPPKFSIDLVFCPMHYYAPEMLQSLMQLEGQAKERLLPKELEDVHRLIDKIQKEK